jgi:hypothetical protein
VLLVVYVALLALVLFWPTSDRQSAAVVWLLRLLTSIGVAPSLATLSRLEVLMNAAIVAPVSLLARSRSPRRLARAWAAYGFVAADQGRVRANTRRRREFLSTRCR